MHQRRAEQECGGTPDVMLLPRLTDYFNTSADYLFGRGKQGLEKLSDFAPQKLKRLERGKQLELVFETCYMIESAAGKIPHHEVFPDQGNFMMWKGEKPLLYQVLYDNVYSCMRLNEEFHYFLYVLQPSCGFLHALPTQEEFGELLALSGKSNYFVILRQLSKCPQERGLQAKGPAKKLSIEEADATQTL